MPARTVESKAVRALALAVAALAGTAHVAVQAAAPKTPVPAASAASAVLPGAKPQAAGSGLTAQLFYQLLVGEMELRSGAPGTAYEVLLDAARKTRDEQIYRRAADIALQARAGDQALAAARAWREALPKSLDAHRYVVQILIALGRVPETAEPLRSLYALTPADQRPSFIGALPRLFARATDTRAAATVVEDVLGGAAQAGPTRVAAMVSIGRAWLAAADRARALQLAQRAARLDPADDGPVVLALELLPTEPAAEAIVTARLEAAPQPHVLRRLYARVLVSMQRYADALAQFETLTRLQPDEPAHWLSLGALRLELKEPRAAAEALQRYVQLAAGGRAGAGRRGVVARACACSSRVVVVARSASASAADDDESQTPAESLVQAYLMLAQSAEQQGDFAGAERWLEKIDDPQRALAVQTRRASLLARQGRMAEARELIRGLPEKTPQEGRAKLLVEAQLLRDAKQWGDAYALLAQGAERFPQDADLLYEQSMVAEKLDRLDEMERLLRRVIEIKPDHQHAYNALGYALADRGQRLDEARTLIRKALDLSPGEPFITDSLGWVEYRLGNRDEAVRLLRQAWRARPDPEIAAHLGEVLWVAGERDEARRILRDAKARDADNEVLRETLTRLKVDL